MKFLLTVIFIVILSGILISCNSGYSTDEETIHAGKLLFEKNCSSCHGFVHDGIGPSLSGVTKKVSPEWLQKFIRNPRSVRDSASVMPAFSSLTEKEITSITAYLNTYKEAVKQEITDTDTLSDPIPEKITSSGIIVDLIPVCSFPGTSADGEPPFTRITKLSYAPGMKTLFVNDMRGILYRLERDQPAQYLNLSQHLPRFIHQPGLGTGFGSFAFHPDFIHNGLLYTTHTEPPGSAVADFTFEDTIPKKLQWVVTEWKTGDPTAKTFQGTSRELLRIDMVAESHGMQEMAFHTNAKKGSKDFGLLYLTVGDGGSMQLGYPFVAQGNGRVWGSVLRIDPAGNNSKNKKYGIPATNPFYRDSSGKAIKEIFVYGFRNPHRITWSPDGDLLVSNIGQANVESLYKLKAGANCGWPMREGAFAFKPYGNFNHLYALPEKDSVQFTYPVIQFDHDEGKAITGGYVYNGTEIPSFRGKLIFGDIPSGRLFISELSTGVIKEWNITADSKSTTLRNLCGIDRVDLHFGMDETGELYILTKSDGKLYRLATK